LMILSLEGLLERCLRQRCWGRQRDKPTGPDGATMSMILGILQSRPSNLS
jgi:hypothetical protein